MGSNGLKESPNIVSTTATGTFTARISDDETTIDYELTFENLEDNVRQAHIHIGHPQNMGGIVLWLCGSATNPGPAGTPLCADPASPRQGVVTGTLTAANVQELGVNGIVGQTATTAGEFAEVVALIRAGKTYVNVHSAKSPPVRSAARSTLTTATTITVGTERDRVPGTGCLVFRSEQHVRLPR